MHRGSFLDKSMDKDYILVADTNGKTGNNTTCSTPFFSFQYYTYLYPF